MQRRYPFFTNQTPRAYDTQTQIFLDAIRLSAHTNKCEWEARLSKKELQRDPSRQILVDL